MTSKPAIVDNISALIGNTPLLKIVRPFCANIYAKLECFNPGFSVKDRIAISMLTDAEERGSLKKGKTILEPTSGNTGIGLAVVCASRGYRLILVMPESMSIERRKILTHLGAKIVLTPAAQGMRGAISKAEEMLASSDDFVMLRQFDNPANPAIHRATTAEEIWQAMIPVGGVDFFVAGVGTGGTITGVGEVLKDRNPNVKIIAVEPQESAILSGGAHSPHKIQGIGAGFKPSILNTKIIDEIIQISSKEAIEQAQKLAIEEGILCGISSGAAYCAARKFAERDYARGKNLVVIFPDAGERYISTDLFL
ncbi:MAG: cysteine synthase A [Oligoflexia bacterium]|nr:cysteine synthase A [Oligoflexia bacterium]